MNRHQVVGLLCLLLLLILSRGASAKIVFSSIRDGVDGIYLMDDDGSNQILLTEDEELRPYPTAWSPNGQQILFKMVGRLFLMDADGTNVRQLTKNDGSTLNMGRFSPDGKSIVFGRTFRRNDKLIGGIYVLNIQTGKMEQISDEWGIMCDWSPNGKHIVFARGQTIGKNSTIWIMGADGHNPRPLIPDPGLQADNFVIYRSRPKWSPNGEKIVFQEKEYKYVQMPDGNFPIFKAFRYIVCDRNGENIKHLQIPKSWEGYGMDWMDDGESIVFGASVDIPLNKPLWRGFEWPPCNIYKYHIQTHERTQLTAHPGTDGIIDWISDDVLSVTPQDKKKVTWGAMKK